MNKSANGINNGSKHSFNFKVPRMRESHAGKIVATLPPSPRNLLSKVLNPPINRDPSELFSRMY